MSGVVDESCQFFQSCVSMINDGSYPIDYNSLGTNQERKVCERLLTSLKENGIASGFDFKGTYAKYPGKNNRVK